MKRVRVTLSPPRVTRGPPPPAPSPSRNGTEERPPSGTGTDEQRERVLSLDDALNFLLSARRALGPAKYQEFLEIFRQRNSIGMGGIADRIKVLFRGHPDLKRHYNMFLPAQYQLSLTDDDEQEEVPTTNGLQGRPTERD